MGVHSWEYERHLDSDSWRRRREARLVEAKRRCERCGCTSGLQLHHRNYDRLGVERADDLELLCLDCHGEADAEREEVAGQLDLSRRAEQYAEARYGEDWRLIVDLDHLEDEYLAWSDE